MLQPGRMKVGCISRPRTSCGRREIAALFKRFYQSLKQKGFVIYPGKVTSVDTFRIGNIGEVDRNDIRRLLGAVEESIDWKQDAVVAANS